MYQVLAQYDAFYQKYPSGEITQVRTKTRILSG